MEKKNQRSSAPKLVPALVAVIVVLAVFSAVSYASGWFGLRELVVQEEKELSAPVLPLQETEEKPVPLPPVRADMISLSGYRESPESRALTEWQAFLDSYDPDGTILGKVGNGPTGVTVPYAKYYLIYTQEMADRLESIAAKYGLMLHTAMYVLNADGLTDFVGREFLAENHIRSGGYAYENGTFSTDGEAELAGHGRISYQLRREVKGTLGDVLLNITDVDTYQTWQYETACGEWVMLALGPSKALIFADYPECFLTVNVLAGTETPAEDLFSAGALDSAELEALADSMDFSVLKTVILPEGEDA